MRWLDGPDDVLHFERAAGLRCAVNLSTAGFDLPARRTTLLRSDTGDGDELGPDSAAWYVAG